MHIYINGIELIKKTKIGRKIEYHMADNSVIYTTEIKTVHYKCSECCKFFKIKKLHHYNYKKPTKCKHCKSNGENNHWLGRKHSESSKKKMSKSKVGKYIGHKNPFFGKHHSKETKYKLSRASSRLTGDKNGFYGRHHSDNTKSIISKRIKNYFNNLSDDERKIHAEKISHGQKKNIQSNPEAYSEIKRKACLIGLNKHERYKKNSIESIVEDELKNRNLEFEYSVILDNKQFDFGCKKYRILLEVNGDYWHGNPDIYSIDELNNIQKRKISSDKIKLEFANSHNMKLFVIWENDIKNKNFTVLDKIVEYIHEIQTGTNQEN